MRDRTVLVIAHRYNAIARADRVIVREDGGGGGAGVPEALMQGDGPYARLLGALSVPLSQVGFCEAACKGAGGKGRWATQGSPPNTTPLPPLRNHDDAFQKPTRVRFPWSAYTTRQQHERQL